VIDKKTAGAVTAACVLVAAIIGFIANVVTVADFFDRKDSADSLPVGSQIVSTSVKAVDEQAERTPVTSERAPVTTVPTLTATADVPTVPVPPETKPRQPAIPQGQAVPSVPEKFIGSWFGIVYQGQVETYPVEVVIAGGSSGAKIGTADYPTLGCGGRWELQAAWENKVRATERIEYQGNCVNTVTIDLLMQPDGQLFYSFRGVEGAGILHRQP